ncbi:MAG: deoxyribonuclease IV, partial [Nitrososphaera sp.]
MHRIKVGFHVSIAGGISNSVDNARKLGCTALQIFSRNPRGWAAKPLDPADVKLFKDKLALSGIAKDSVVVHMPYLPNLSGPPGEFYEKSARTLTEEVQRCMALGIQNLVIHLGSHLGKGTAQGMTQLTSAVDDALGSVDKSHNQNRVNVLLENNAGQKNSIGGSFEELRTILDKITINRHVGVCLDTCHLFASGYDIRSANGVKSTLEKFDKIVGLRELSVIHLNDSKGELGSNLDRHQHIGLGRIGPDGISAFLTHRAT